MVKVDVKGDFRHLEGFLKEQKEHKFMERLDYYGQMGVEALKQATPKRTGKTADSWYYYIRKYDDSGSWIINWCNSNVNVTPHGRANIALIIETGHATRNGAYIAGREYIKPAIEPIFNKITQEIVKGVKG